MWNEGDYVFKSLLSEWKKNKFSLVLMIVGYIIGLSVLALGVSMVQENKKNYEYSVSGNPEHYGSISVRGEDLPTYSDVVDILGEFSKRNEVQFGFSGATIEGVQGKKTVIPTIFQELPEFTPPLLKGRYFTIDEVNSNNSLVVVGKEVYEQVKSSMINNFIKINGSNYKVIGVLGRSETGSQWDSAVYMPLYALPQSLQSIKQESYNIFLRNNNGDPSNYLDNLEGKFYELNSSLKININKEIDSSKKNESIWINAVFISLLSGVILFVSCINVINLSLYWILDRKREIGIRKAIGASNRNIASLIFFEMLVISLVSSLITLVLLFVLGQLSNYFNYSISLFNCFLLVSTSLFCGLITSIFPVRSAIKIQAIEIIKRG